MLRIFKYRKSEPCRRVQRHARWCEHCRPDDCQHPKSANFCCLQGNRPANSTYLQFSSREIGNLLSVLVRVTNNLQSKKGPKLPRFIAKCYFALLQGRLNANTSLMEYCTEEHFTTTPAIWWQSSMRKPAPGVATASTQLSVLAQQRAS